MKKRMDLEDLLLILQESGWSEYQNWNDVMRIDKKYGREIVPVLLKYLPKLTWVNSQEMVVRAITVPGYTEALPDLMNLFKTTSAEHLRWAIGNAIATIGIRKIFEEVLELLKDKKYGGARMMLVYAVGKTRDERALPVLFDIVDEEHMTYCVLSALGYYTGDSVEKVISRYLNSTSKEIQNMAKKALARSRKRLSYP